MENNSSRLKALLGEIDDLNDVIALLDWDQQTYMPQGGAEGRGYQLATLSRLSHVKFTSPEIGQLLEDWKSGSAQLDPDSDDARLIRVTRREYDKQVKVPADFVAEFAQATAIGQQAWMQAREASDFAKFQPHLQKLVELRRQYSGFFAPYDHVYDPLLDDFEPGLKTADVKAIFGALRPRQIELIRAIAGRPAIDDSFLHVSLDEKRELSFDADVITRFGFDWNRGRQDKSAHPFSTSFGTGDVRITTRYVPGLTLSSLFSTMHEAGHALYEQGFAPTLSRTPLANAASLAVHESQSRLWENLVGRSRDFWGFFYPRLQEWFPAEFANVDLDRFYRAINKVERSMIRVEADEATYNLHIMLRLELEIELIEGSLDVRHLPEAWNTRMQEFLGLTPRNDAAGVLQDIHWSGGAIGYFPTYALGNLISVQLWEKIESDLPDLPEQVRRGEFSMLLGWLREKIHRHGAKFEPQELVQRVTGSKIDPEPYLRYLNKKYSEIYHL